MIIRTYFDATSTEKDKGQPLTVAGTVATEESWSEFELAWQAALQVLGPPGVTHFHAVDCAHCREQFAPWRDPARNACAAAYEPARRALLGELIAIIRRNIMFGVTFTIKPSDYNAVSQDYQLATDFWSGAYSFAATGAMIVASQLVEEHFPNAEMFSVLESGDAGQGPYASMMQRFQELGMAPPWSVLPEYNKTEGKWLHAFGASDFVAYEHGLALKALARNSKPTRGSFLALRKAIRIRSGFASQEQLRGLCESMPDIFPRRHDNLPPPGEITEEAAQRQQFIIDSRQQISKAEREIKRMMKLIKDDL